MRTLEIGFVFMKLPIEVILSMISPMLGALIGVLKAPKRSVVYHLLAFAGGIMIAISFLDLIPTSVAYGGLFPSLFGLTIGFLVMNLVHIVLPTSQSLKETATFLAIGMAIHNIAEGMAIAITSNISKSLSFVVVAGIFIHDFAEGLCTASPLYFSSKKKLRSFVMTAMTSLTLLLGFLSIQIFFGSISTLTIGFLLGLVAGLMLNITFTELVPESAHKSTGFKTEFSLLAGMLVVLLLEFMSLK